MNSKVKLFFVFLAVLAVISVFSFFDILGGVRSANFNQAAKPLPSTEKDADHDGLADTEESYWNTDFQNPDTDGDGFLDGEEVSSGFDPREPSNHKDGDSLEDTVFGTVKTVEAGDFEEINFTDTVGQNILGGIAAGDLKRDADPDTKATALAILADSTVEDFYKSLPVFTPSFNIVDSSDKNQLIYLKALAIIIQNNLIDTPQKLDLTQNPFTQSDFFLPRSEHFRISRDSASQLNVPQNWVDIHNKVLTLLNLFYLNHLAIGNYSEDSIKAVIAFNAIENMNNEVRDILKQIQERIKINGLNPEDTVFKILGELYK